MEDVNRYATKTIVIIIVDEFTANLRITGSVTDNNVAGWVASLEATFGIRAGEQPGRIVLRQN